MIIHKASKGEIMNINRIFNTSFYWVFLMSLALFLPEQSYAAHILEVLDVKKDPSDVPQPITRQENKTVTINLEYVEVIADIGAGKKAWVWTFNGTVPGPMIRVMEGDTVEIKVSNPTINHVEHDIDLHAVNGPGGGANVTLVEPGDGTKTFVFKALKQGAYIYHCAADGEPWVHVAYGMTGLIYVEPPGGLPLVDKEFYFGINEWYLEDVSGSEAKKYNLPDNILVLNEGAAEKEKSDFSTLNGNKTPQTITVNQGEKVRIFYVDGGPNKVSQLRIPGITFTRIVHGHAEDELINKATVIVPPGAATFFEFVAPQMTKMYSIEDSLLVPSQGSLGKLQVVSQP